MSEIAIQATAVDAVSSKIYCVRNNYYSDPALVRLVPQQVDRKSPEIARGTWARVQSTRNFIKSFLTRENSRPKIVVNCGAGFDTGYWWAADRKLIRPEVDRWFDVDMEGVVRKKVRSLRMPQCKQLLSDLKNLSLKENRIKSESYNLCPLDLKSLDQIRHFFENTVLTGSQSGPEVDICFVFECVLVYMPIAESDQLLSYLSGQFPNAWVVSYEQVNLNDRFGQVMLENLTTRGCGLDGIDACLTPASQEDRFRRNGFCKCICTDMYSTYLSLPERERIETLEFLDDVEIFRQLLQHYSITTANN